MKLKEEESGGNMQQGILENKDGKYFAKFKEPSITRKNLKEFCSIIGIKYKWYRSKNHNIKMVRDAILRTAGKAAKSFGIGEGWDKNLIE